MIHVARHIRGGGVVDRSRPRPGTGAPSAHPERLHSQVFPGSDPGLVQTGHPGAKLLRFPPRPVRQLCLT
jgi:hypothetical protein